MSYIGPEYQMWKDKLNLEINSRDQFDLWTLPIWEDPLWENGIPRRNPPPLGSLTPSSFSFVDGRGSAWWLINVNGIYYKLAR